MKARNSTRSGHLQLVLLFTRRIEIFGLQPGLAPGSYPMPVLVQHGVPGGVAILALDHEVLAEDPFEAEAEALGGLLGYPRIRRIQNDKELLAAKTEYGLLRACPRTQYRRHMAERLIAERGIEAVSLREIGAAAGQRNSAASSPGPSSKFSCLGSRFRSQAMRSDSIASVTPGVERSEPIVADVLHAGWR